MNRITKIISERKNRKLLIPFFTAGYPSIDMTMSYIKTAEDCGADMIEIGIPFSDPLADGPEIQFSSKSALDSGISLKNILSMVEKIRKKSEIPVILMGYYNPLISFGENKFFRAANSSGVDGLIIPDLPVEEAGLFQNNANSLGLSTIFLAAPTSSESRIKTINKLSTDFVYAVTVTGVTGSGQSFGSETDLYLKKLRRSLTKPFVAGFGISSPERAKRLAGNSDGVVIGSALVKLIKSSDTKKDSIKNIEKFLKSIRKVLK